MVHFLKQLLQLLPCFGIQSNFLCCSNGDKWNMMLPQQIVYLFNSIGCLTTGNAAAYFDILQSEIRLIGQHLHKCHEFIIHTHTSPYDAYN